MKKAKEYLSGKGPFPSTYSNKRGYHTIEICQGKSAIDKALEIAYLEGMLNVSIATNGYSPADLHNNVKLYYGNGYFDEGPQEISDRLKQLLEESNR